jgi:hypothetical protein
MTVGDAGVGAGVGSGVGVVATATGEGAAGELLSVDPPQAENAAAQTAAAVTANNLGGMSAAELNTLPGIGAPVIMRTFGPR